MNRKTLGSTPETPPPLNDAPDIKARSYSLALCGLDQGWKKPRFFGIFLRFLGFLGFNVHNAEHRLYDPQLPQVAYMKMSANSFYYSVPNFPIWKW